MTNDGINPDAGAPQEEAPEAQQSLISAEFPSKDSARCHLNLINVSSMQLWALIGLLKVYADSMYIQERQQADEVRARIQPVAAIPSALNRAQRRRGN